MRRVVICSPYRGNVEGNVDYAVECLAHSVAQGEAPIAFHLLYPRVLDDDKAEERDQGFRMTRRWLPVADALVVYNDHGVTDGMAQEITMAIAMAVPVEYRGIETESQWKTKEKAQ